VQYDEGTLSTVDRQETLIDRLTEWLKDRGLAEPAIVLFEAGKPLLPVGSQVLLFLQPILGSIAPVLGWFDDNRIVAEYAKLLEDPASIDRILMRLEHGAVE
jgi:hypothetical protein